MNNVLLKGNYLFLGLLYKRILPSYLHENYPDYTNENVGVVGPTNESFVGVVHYSNSDNLWWIKFYILLGL